MTRLRLALLASLGGALMVAAGCTTPPQTDERWISKLDTEDFSSGDPDTQTRAIKTVARIIADLNPKVDTLKKWLSAHTHEIGDPDLQAKEGAPIPKSVCRRLAVANAYFQLILRPRPGLRGQSEFLALLALTDPISYVRAGAVRTLCDDKMYPLERNVLLVLLGLLEDRGSSGHEWIASEAEMYLAYLTEYDPSPSLSGEFDRTVAAHKRWLLQNYEMLMWMDNGGKLGNGGFVRVKR
jgi:hypothetical protein